MRLGFYYHSPIKQKKNSLYMPSYIGIFIDSLALYVERLIIFGHSSKKSDEFLCDYKINSKNVDFISLGSKTSALHRTLNHGKILSKIKDYSDSCDIFLIRAPSPLSSFFKFSLPQSKKIIYLIVGDNIEGIKISSLNIFRELSKCILILYAEYFLNKSLKESLVLVNSKNLYKKYMHSINSLHEVKTTTISKNDITLRSDSFNDGNEINLLYSGRFDVDKGVLDIIEAGKILIDKLYNIKINFVGWENNTSQPVKNMIIKKAQYLNISKHLIFHNKKPVGPELFKLYKDCQIFILPSYYEGFPRTIWEAMANCTPVVSTNVGSIPLYTTHKENILITEPGAIKSLASGIEKLIEDKSFRKKIIKGGNKLVKEMTLENQTKILFNHIYKELHS